MKKAILGVSILVLTLATVSCGGGHTCDAYRKADFNKKKEVKAAKKIQKVITRK